MSKLTDHYHHAGPGWHALLTMLHTELDAICEYEAIQVKEKFGALRVYINIPGKERFPFSHPAYYLVHRYEVLSMSVCELCGHEGTNTPSESGWYRTRCTDCPHEPSGGSSVPARAGG
jgi:hypothetical protein